MRITIDGKLNNGVTPKVALFIISKLTTSGATGYFVEYHGEVFRELSMEGRMTVCNLSIEMGARGEWLRQTVKLWIYMTENSLQKEMIC